MVEKRKVVKMKKDEQVDTFARVMCPKCKKEIDVEVLINTFDKKLPSE
jgi:hypothetical protein